MSDRSALLSLPYILPSQAQKHVTHNEALRQLDLVVQLSVTERVRTSPPDTPLEGDRYIVGEGANGDWAGHDRNLAFYDSDAGWLFTTPKPGWCAYILAEEVMVAWNGSDWHSIEPDFDNLDGLGVNTSSDAANRLAVASPATLLTHEGAGHQLKINKAEASDTASLVFQTDWGGRAEMGTAGSDAFTIKVSADGGTWHTGLSIDPVDGQITAQQGLSAPALTGLAVQQTETDTTVGRVMRADWGYSPGNAVGTVSESGGTPTGAIVETGSTADGHFTRFADGTQICTGSVTLPYLDSLCLEGDWTYPAVFDGGFQSVWGTLDTTATEPNINPQLTKISAVMWADSGNNNATGRLSVRRISGSQSFIVGDFAVIQATAFGRWF